MTTNSTTINKKLIPHFTQIPDLILDSWMSEMSGAEFKVLMYVARRTYGFRRESDDISIDQMADGIVTRDGRRLDGGTGLSRSTVAKTVADLVGKKVLIRKTRTDERGGNLPSTFSINFSSDFGTKLSPAKEGVRKSDPMPDAYNTSCGEGVQDSDMGESEKQTPFAHEGVQKSDGEETRKSDPTASDFRTHNIQCSDRQSEDKQIYIQQQQTDTPAAKTEHTSASTLDVVVDGYVKNTSNELVEKLVAIGITKSKASILAADFPDRIENQIAYLPHRTARDRAATLIYAIEGNWSVPPSYAEAQDMVLREQREKETKEKIRAVQVAEQAEKERKKEAFAAAWEAMPDEDRSQMERTAWKHLAQSGGPIGSKAKDVLRGDIKPSEIMAGNAVRCVFQSMLEKMVVQDAEVSANLHGSPDPPNL